MKELQVSLYDIFGYAAPGAIAFLGIYLLGWRIVLPPTLDWSTVSIGGWVVILLVSYVLGHAVQALANLFIRLFNVSPEATELGDIETSSPQIFASIHNYACRVADIPNGTALPARVIFEIIDAYVMQNGKTESRDIYIYREGFYRGLTVSLLMFAIGSLTRMTGTEGSINIFGTLIWLTSGVFGAFGVVAIGMSLLSFMRFKRFASYRVRNSVFGFLTIIKP